MIVNQSCSPIKWRLNGLEYTHAGVLAYFVCDHGRFSYFIEKLYYEKCRHKMSHVYVSDQYKTIFEIHDSNYDKSRRPNCLCAVKYFSSDRPILPHSPLGTFSIMTVYQNAVEARVPYYLQSYGNENMLISHMEMFNAINPANHI